MLPEDQPQPTAPEPGDCHVCLVESGGDQIPKALLLAGRSALPNGLGEEGTRGILTEVVDENAEVTGGVAESGGRLGGTGPKPIAEAVLDKAA
jgi:hypothetical protein